MISIIICSRNTTISKSLSENIRNTVGSDHELVIIDNSEKIYSIFQAYNLGVERSRFDILCFMHEDVFFHTNNWGPKVIEHFKDPNIGIIGVAGSHYIPRLPSAHWSSGITSYNVIHTIHGKTTLDSWRYIDGNEVSIPAVILDGLWICIPKVIMKRIRFDEVTFSGFHCYDADLCLQVKSINYEVRIVFDILIEHFSLGKRERDWLTDVYLLFDKWKNKLPLRSVELTKSQVSIGNYHNAKELLGQMLINNGSLWTIIRTSYLYLQCNPPVNKLNVKLLMYIIRELNILFVKKIKKV